MNRPGRELYPDRSARHRFGYELRTRRKARGLSQDRLGAAVHVSGDLVGRIEIGDRRPGRDFAERCDRVLDAGGELVRLWEAAEHEQRQRRRADTGPVVSDNMIVGNDLAFLPAASAMADDMNRMNRRYLLKTLGVGAASLSPLGSSVREMVLGAANSSALLRASVVGIPGTSEHALGQTRHQLCRFATDYALTPDLVPILCGLVVLRNHLYTTVATRQHHPSDTRDLYVLLGATCVLLASISHDLSEPHAGLIQADTAETFAELSGDRALLTWVYCTKAMIASWWGTPDDVLRQADKARATGAAGVAAIRLAGLQARTLAQLGKRTEAVAILYAAEEQRAAVGEHDRLRELGEIFTFPVARQHYYNAATHLYLHNWAEVEHETSSVVNLYGKSIAGGTWPVTLTLSRIYQAQARLQIHGPEAAREALQPVFDIPITQRLHQTAKALETLRRQLQSPTFATLTAARDLSDDIVSFQSSAAGR